MRKIIIIILRIKIITVRDGNKKENKSKKSATCGLQWYTVIRVLQVVNNWWKLINDRKTQFWLIIYQLISVNRHWLAGLGNGGLLFLDKTDWKFTPSPFSSYSQGWKNGARFGLSTVFILDFQGMGVCCSIFNILLKIVGYQD